MPGASVDVVTGHTPGLIGRVTKLHAHYYARHWNFGSFFEARVASEASGFRLVSEQVGTQWGNRTTEQLYEWLA